VLTSPWNYCEGKFQLWKRVKTGFYNSGENNTLTVIKLEKSIRHYSKLQASLKTIKIKKEEVNQFTSLIKTDTFSIALIAVISGFNT